jgi:ABC-type sugar transport system permease subunit
MTTPRVSSGTRVTRRAQARLGILLVLPVAAMVLVFFLVPLANAVYYSLTDFDGIDPTPSFVGLDNITRMFSDPTVGRALLHNLAWIVVGTVSPMVIGLLVAMLLWTTTGRTGLYRLLLFLPFVLPGVAVGIVWGWIYDPIHGTLNGLLGAVGLDALQHGWLGEPDTALLAVVATAVWAGTGFAIVIFLAALRNVDVELVDASRIDGANAVQRLRYVVLPQIMPVFLMVLTLTLVGGFSVFDIIFIMTGGGPAGATEVLGTYAYANAFQLSDIGYGTTIALLMTVLAVPCAVALNRLQRRWSLLGTGA